MQNNLKTLATLTVGIITALVVIVGVFIPITSGLEENIVSTANNTTDRFMVADDDLSVVVEYVEGTGFLINGDVYQANSQLVVIADGITVAMTAQPIGITDTQNGFVGVTNKITFSEGTFSYSAVNSTTVYTGTYETLLYPDENGDYGCFMGVYGEAIPFTADKESVVYAIQRTGDVRFVAEIQNGVRTGYFSNPISYINNTYSEYSGTITMNITGETTEDGLGYAYSRIAASYGDSTTVTPNVYAPIFYHTIDSNAEAARAIVGVLPLILILGLIIMAGYAMMSMIRSRNEL